MNAPSVNIAVTAGSSPESTSIRFDPTFLRTLSGILKLVELIVDLCGFICMKVFTSDYHYPAGGWYEFVALSAFIITLLLIISYVFHFNEAIRVVPWLLGEIIFSIVWAIFFIIASGIVSSYASFYAALGAASFFGFLAAVLYLYEGFAKFRIRSQG